MLVSTAQQSELYIYRYSLFFGFPSQFGHHKALNIGFPVLYSRFSSIVYIVSVDYICQSQSPNSSHFLFPPRYPSVCSLSMFLFLLCKFFPLSFVVIVKFFFPLAYLMA